ncbi:MAG: helix-turn-helix domain-containing protein [Paenalcaligenes sp.]
MENNFKQFSDRICLAVDQVGDDKNLSEKMGIPISVLQNWREGSAEPSRSDLLKISAATKLSVGWLASGEGNPYLRNPIYPPPMLVDLDSLEKIIAKSKRFFLQEDLSLQPEAEAHAIRLIYEFYLRQNDYMDDATLKNLIELLSMK